MTAARARVDVNRHKVGGIAALYLALALVAAIPFFLVVVDYPSAASAADKVGLIADNYASMYAAYLATYVLFGIAVGILALALHDRLRAGAPLTARVAAIIGLTWSFALVASGLIFTYGITAIHDLAATDYPEAVLAWQAIEPVAMALGGAGGELLGGLWVLLIGLVVLQTGALPKGLGWLGVAIGLVGLVSVVPPLHDAALAFGLLEIIWLTWLGVVLLTMKEPSGDDRQLATLDDFDLSPTEAPL